MTRIAVPLTILAAAVLAACTSPGPNNPASATIATQQMPYWAGSGVVQSRTAAPAAMASSGNSVSAASTAAPSGNLYRLGIRMDNGRMMYVDTPSTDIPVGTRVQITENYEIKRM